MNWKLQSNFKESNGNYKSLLFFQYDPFRCHLFCYSLFDAVCRLEYRNVILVLCSGILVDIESSFCCPFLDDERTETTEIYVFGVLHNGHELFDKILAAAKEGELGLYSSGVSYVTLVRLK